MLDGSLFMVCSHGGMQGVGETVLGQSSLFYKSINLFLKSPPSWPTHLPKSPPPSGITFGVRFEHVNLRAGDTHSL